MVQPTMRSIYISSENEWTQSLYEKTFLFKLFTEFAFLFIKPPITSTCWANTNRFIRSSILSWNTSTSSFTFWTIPIPFLSSTIFTWIYNSASLCYRYSIIINNFTFNPIIKLIISKIIVRWSFPIVFYPYWQTIFQKNVIVP